MAIGVDINGNYGGTLVNQKYKPLDRMVWVGTDAPIYNGMLANRWRLLNSAELLPQPLRLAVPNWIRMVASEAYMNPPLVVISTNRSSWIASGFEAIGKKRFANPSDLQALRLDDNPSPPIYCPARNSGAGPRNVYLIVHMSEYTQYKRALADYARKPDDEFGLTVVGWEFHPPAVRTGPKKVLISGFGASRFAAIEFCKELRESAPKIGGNPPWDYAWLIDDNVVALGRFPGYKAVEAVLKADTDLVCAGFKGGTSVDTRADNKQWAKDEIDAGRGKQADTLPPSETPNVIQQTALWNIKYLTDQHMNFGPAFINSAEDVSLVQYLDRLGAPYRFYKGITVRKEEAAIDKGGFGASIRSTRQRFTTWVTEMESTNPATGTPPPPISVQPVGTGGGPEQTLASFVVNNVLPHCLKTEEAGDLNAQNVAKSQAVEQLISEAINRVYTVRVAGTETTHSYIADATLNNTFKINGTNPQRIDRIDKP